MPGQLQNKLQQFEIAPPPSVWNKIAQQLDKEFVASDIALSSTLEDTAIPPPPQAWENIAASIGVDKRARVVPIIYKRIAAAAIILGLISVSYFYFLAGSSGHQPETATVIPVTPKPRDSKPLVADATPPVTVPRKSRPVQTTKTKRQSAAQYAATTRQAAVETRVEPLSSPQQAPLYELNTVSALQPVSVSAPPLRDKSGKLILDLNTISNPNDEYITVTGPNGKQTKISAKFLSCLGYINGSVSYSGMDAKAIRCTLQFDEWRKRLLSDPAFIPTANNFFDIFELKDLLQEM